MRPEKADALWIATDIHRRLDRREWLDAIERVPEQHRDEVREYLRGLWERARIAREAKVRKAQGSASVARDQSEPQGKRRRAADA